MIRCLSFLGLLLLSFQAAVANNFTDLRPSALDPIYPHITSGGIPPVTVVGGIYQLTYTITSNLPFSMPSSFFNILEVSSNEFTIADNCYGVRLNPQQSCTISVVFQAQTHGIKSATIFLNYGKNSVPITVLTKVESTR